MPMRIAAISLACLFVSVPLEAQRPDSGAVVVTVRESMSMVDGFLVRSENRTSVTDAGGVARLVLPAGRQVLLVTRIGFAPKRLVRPAPAA